LKRSESRQENEKRRQGKEIKEVRNETIKAVIFDLGRVLIDVDLTKGIFKYTLSGKAPSEKQVLDTLMKDSFYQDYACGRFPAERFQQEFCRRLNLDMDFETFKKEWNNVFKPIPEMEGLVRQVSKKYQTGLLSDIGPLHWEYLYETLPVLKTFSNPLLSYKIGILKPDEETYLLAAESAGTVPEKCLFIDDREINVQGAEKAGMKALLFKGPAKLRSDMQKMGISGL